MALQPYSAEQLNFLKFTSIVFDEFPNNLRQIFVDMWNNRIAPLHGNKHWDDSIAVRGVLYTYEGGNTKIPTTSSFQNWDCTALFQATLYAKTFALPDTMGVMKTLSQLYCRNPVPGPFHSPVVSTDPNETTALAIDQIRLLRNVLCHSANSQLDKTKFDNYVTHAKEAFTAVKLSTSSLEAIGNYAESDFPIAKVQELNEAVEKARNDYCMFLKNDVKADLNDILKKIDGISERTGMRPLPLF